MTENSSITSVLLPVADDGVSLRPEHEVEEFFEAMVEAIEGDSLCLRTVSSEGEEATAWLPISEVPVTERPYIRLGAPLRVSIIVSARGTRKREHRVRFLRPSQWRPTDDPGPAASWLLDQMQSLLKR